MTKGVITVIAGINGAGKSSITGSHITANGGQYFNPDEHCRDLMRQNPKMTLDEASGEAWKAGYEMLRRAIENGDPLAFETTLGGSSISDLLEHAMPGGTPVRILYTGLSSPELHIERVAARVKHNGHDIPEDKIRARWKTSVLNMIRLIPHCSEIVVYDNSAPSDEGGPKPVRLFSMRGDEFTEPPVNPMPEWAKPMALEALKRAFKTKNGEA